MNKEVLLEVRHLCKQFPVKSKKFSKGGAVYAVDDVNFCIHKGETLGLVGESGCGKSTLSRSILNLIKPTSGDVIFENKNLTAMDKKEMCRQREYIRMIFQKPYGSLNPRETVKDIVSAPFSIHKSLTKQEREREVLRLMDKVGLNPSWMNRYPHEFSGGQRQRIGIARALAGSPKLILCDEPVSALDVSIQAQVLNLLKDLQQEMGLTYLFISHNLSVVRFMADRIAVMYLGSVVELADSDTIYKNSMHPYTQALLSAIPEANTKPKKERIILEGDIPSPVNPPQGCRFCTRCRYAKDICREKKPELLNVGENHFSACYLYQKGGS